MIVLGCFVITVGLVVSTGVEVLLSDEEMGVELFVVLVFVLVLTMVLVILVGVMLGTDLVLAVVGVEIRFCGHINYFSYICCHLISEKFIKISVVLK